MSFEHTGEYSNTNTQSINEATAMRKKIALELAHVMIRWERGEISNDDYHYLRDRYTHQSAAHSDEIDLKTVEADLLADAEESRLEAQADMWDAMHEQNTDTLPPYELKINKSYDQLMNEVNDLSHDLQDEQNKVKQLERQLTYMKDQLEDKQADVLFAEQKARSLGIQNEGLREKLAEAQSRDMVAHIGWTE